MNPARVSLRFLTFLLLYSLTLPNPALALREQSEVETSGLEELTRALRGNEPDAVVNTVSHPFARLLAQPPAVQSSTSLAASGLEEKGVTRRDFLVGGGALLAGIAAGVVGRTVLDQAEPALPPEAVEKVGPEAVEFNIREVRLQGNRLTLTLDGIPAGAVASLWAETEMDLVEGQPDHWAQQRQATDSYVSAVDSHGKVTFAIEEEPLRPGHLRVVIVKDHEASGRFTNQYHLKHRYMWDLVSDERFVSGTGLKIVEIITPDQGRLLPSLAPLATSPTEAFGIRDGRATVFTDSELTLEILATKEMLGKRWVAVPFRKLGDLPWRMNFFEGQREVLPVGADGRIMWKADRWRRFFFERTERFFASKARAILLVEYDGLGPFLRVYREVGVLEASKLANKIIVIDDDGTTRVVAQLPPSGLEESMVIDGVSLPPQGWLYDGYTTADGDQAVPRSNRVLALLEPGEKRLLVPRATSERIVHRLFRQPHIDLQASLVDALGEGQVIDLPPRAEQIPVFWKEWQLREGDVVLLDVALGWRTGICPNHGVGISL